MCYRHEIIQCSKKEVCVIACCSDIDYRGKLNKDSVIIFNYCYTPVLLNTSFLNNLSFDLTFLTLFLGNNLMYSGEENKDLFSD